MALSTTISISRVHALTIDEIKARLEGLRQKFAEGPTSFTTSWHGNILKIAGAGFRGWIEVGVDRVDLEAQLGLLLIPLRASIETQLAAELDQLVLREAG